MPSCVSWTTTTPAGATSREDARIAPQRHHEAHSAACVWERAVSIAATCYLDLDGNGIFETDISTYLLSASVSEGRAKSLDPMNQATATIKLNNGDGRFSVKNTGGPYYPSFREGDCGVYVRAGADQRSFSGYITQITQDPYIGEQAVVLQCESRLARAARQLLKAGPFRQQPVNLILNRLLDLLEYGEEITNPGGEGGSTTGYSALGGGSLSAPNTISLEGDYCIQAICDGAASGQGYRYDLGVAANSKHFSLAARTAPGDGNATFTVRGLNASFVQQWAINMAVVDNAWTYFGDTLTVVQSTYSYRYLEVITQSAIALTLLTDCLHQVPRRNWIYRDISSNLNATAELVALYDVPALSALERLVASEAAGFLWMGSFSELYGCVYARCQADRDGDTTPDATFADDGSGAYYTSLEFGRDTREVISEAQVESEGDYSEDNEETTVWELSPLPLVIPASSTVKLRAEYASPARGCYLDLAAEVSGVFPVADAAHDGHLQKYGAAYPPTTDAAPQINANQMFVGQQLSAAVYRKNRGYHRFTGTSAVGAGETVNTVIVRLKLLALYATQAFTLEVRQPGSSTYDWGTLTMADWRATPSSDPLIGSIDSVDLPPVGQWFDITLDAACINKGGTTAFYLISSRDTAGSAPTAQNEHVVLGGYGGSAEDFAELIIGHSALPAPTEVFFSYGAGADIELTAGAEGAVVYGATIKGIPYSQGAERSLVVADAVDPPSIPNPLRVEMPHQGTRTPDMETEATRLAARYDLGAAVDRVKVGMAEQDASSLAQMQQRQLNDLVTVKNLKFDWATKINGNFFIERIAWQVTDQGKVLAVQFDLEQK